MSAVLLEIKNTKWRRVNNWWANTPLSSFDPLIDFANEDIRDNTWAEALWNAMGNESFSIVTYTVNGQSIEETILSGDIFNHVDEEAINDIRHDLPKVSGRDPSFQLTKDLQSKVRCILDLITVNLDEGKEGGILRRIETDFNQPETRRAIISSSGGFEFFDDMGEDATRTLSWMLSGFLIALSEHDCAILKKCRSCNKYFVNTTRHKKYYCSNNCRFDYHNKMKPAS